ncbi:hypothetical protein ACFL7E_03605 [Thermodesulfobacteriota bacterium]
MNEETKICPDCAETIKVKAKKCRFCGKEFDPEEVAKQVEISLIKLAECEGIFQCPECNGWNVKWGYKTQGMGYYCYDCKKALKEMGINDVST